MSGIIHNPATRRFELHLTDPAGAPQIAFIDYLPRGDTLVLTHAEVPAALGGQGIGGKMVQLTLDFLRDEGVRIIPTCPFIAVWIKRHPAYTEMVADLD